MQIAASTIRQAFERYHITYAVRERAAWLIPHHVELWQRAQVTWAGPDEQAFEQLYHDLRRHWQVFRGAGQHLRAQETFHLLCSLPADIQQASLSTLQLDQVPQVLETVRRAAAIKTNKHGPSVVAISKFLHFWNPSLFVIVDYGVMGQYVFAHRWLRDSLRASTQALAGELNLPVDGDPLLDYVGVLWWAAQLVAGHPQIACEFDRYVQSQVAVPAALNLVTHEAAAVEWMLLGLVEVPPAGVRPEST